MFGTQTCYGSSLDQLNDPNLKLHVQCKGEFAHELYREVKEFRSKLNLCQAAE